MTEQMYAPQADPLVQDYLMDLIDCYAGLHPDEPRRNALLHAITTVFSPEDMSTVNATIEGGSDPILGEETGAKFIFPTESRFEDRREIHEYAYARATQYMVEIERRGTLDAVSCAFAWSMDETYAAMCINAYRNEDEDNGNRLLFGAANMIVQIAANAHTSTGERIKLDQAIRAVRTTANRHSQSGDIAQWCQMLVSCLQRAVQRISGG